MRASRASLSLRFAHRVRSYLAAVALERGCELITADRDFRRFPGLRWRHPLERA